jgi:hypothetical protein
LKIGKSASEMLVLLTVAYGEYTMKKLSAFEWRRWFKKGREDVQGDPGSGQPKTLRTDANVDRVQTVNQQCYLEVPTRLWESVQWERPELWHDKWILQHDSAPAHDALKEFASSWLRNP